MKDVVRFKKEDKRIDVLVYGGRMPKWLRKVLGGPKKERAMMLYDVKANGQRTRDSKE